MKRIELSSDYAQSSVPAAAADRPLIRTAITHQLTMSKKIVVKADLVGKTCMRDIMSVAATLQGIKSMDVDAEKCTLTVVGTVDPVCIAQKLKKKCFAVNIISVEDDKPKPPAPPPDPCKEVCEKKCDKITCCKECKDECKETCERQCKAWLESGGCCSCCTRCAMPSYPYNGCSGGSWPWPYGY